VKKLKVLIVDDSSVLRKIVERALRQAGLDIAEVLEASNGPKPWPKFKKALNHPKRHQHARNGRP
jgi:two-component system, chemotaxis family, chemotaxis protein CheY